VRGIWQNDEAEEAAKYQLKPGDFKVVDVDGNYVYDALVDKQFMGYEQPRHRIGFRNSIDFLKNFSVSFFFRAELGHLGYFAEAARAGGTDTYDKRSTYDLPYWTPENGNDEYARLNTITTVFGGGIKVYKPLSYLRLQDLSFSYTIPNTALEKINLKNLRVFLAARNVFTIDKWPGWDPETAYNSQNTMPMPRTFSAGLNFSL